MPLDLFESSAAAPIMAVPVLRQPQQMMALLMAQQAVNAGPGDGELPQGLGEDALAAYLRPEGRIHSAGTSQVFSAAPRIICISMQVRL